MNVGKYVIERRLGSGGMGDVWLARDPDRDCLVAVKVPHRLGRDGRERFRREAETVRALDHPHVCRLFEVGEHEGCPFLVMQYVEGQSLAARVGPNDLWEFDRAADLVERLARIMHYVHGRGVVHRDLKPSNVMIDGANRPVVLDFGLARNRADSRLTSDGTSLGTPGYVAPEQARGEWDAVGPASDVYSLGVVLYELLTGRVPFQDVDSDAVRRAILADRLPPPSDFRPHLVPALEAACVKALAREPKDRHESMAAFAEALRACQTAAPPQRFIDLAIGTGPTPEQHGPRTAPPSPRPAPAVVVSCDVVGHSREKDLLAQYAQLRGINELVREFLVGCPEAAWASRGDGGHLIFTANDWRGLALRAVRELRAWADRTRTPLRVVAHKGEVARFVGADGRAEFVGDEINFVGRLSSYGAAGRVVVSAAFAEAFGPGAGLRFHEPRSVRPRYFGPHTVMLASADGAFASSWDAPRDDRAALREALAEGRGWEVVLAAKRLLQIDTQDHEADEALVSLTPGTLTYRDHVTRLVEPNPFVGLIDGHRRADLVRGAQLLAREDGDRLCEAGDTGDTLLVLLSGQVEILPPGRPADEPPIFRDVGDMVGELSFQLGRPRTAAMRCCGRCALLAVSHALVERMGELRGWFDQRVLKFVCVTADYLAGGDDPPLPVAARPWQRLLADMRRVSVRAGDAVRRGDAPFDVPGVWVLARGRLSGGGRTLEATQCPAAWADLPGRYVSEAVEYVAGQDATLVRVAPAPLARFGPEAMDRVVGRLRQALG